MTAKRREMSAGGLSCWTGAGGTEALVSAGRHWSHSAAAVNRRKTGYMEDVAFQNCMHQKGKPFLLWQL